MRGSVDKIRPTIPDNMLLSWQSQVRQYPERGTPGISYTLEHVKCDGKPVDCLVYRSKSGAVIGILNHYPVDHIPFEKQGNCNIWIHPKHQGRGIGTALLKEADKRWNINLEQQRYSSNGLAFIKHYLKNGNAGK